MLDFFQFTMGSFASLFPVADPLGAVPLFIVLSANAPPELRKEFASKIGLYTILVLVIFLFIGGSILNFFGISIAVVKIAGGAVIFEAGWQALKEGSQLTPENKTVAIAEVKEHENIAFIPMTIPLLAGPGSIAVTLGLAAQAGQDFTIETGLNYGAAIVAIAMIGFLSFICLRLSSWFLEVFGETGIMAISRLLGLFILAVGVQLILNGFTDWIHNFNGEEASLVKRWLSFLIPNYFG
jgi:multiple antibiotic resistance protein